MIREDIFGGLKLAVSKKESLKQAMMTFYNACYKKQDIEDSAKALLQMGQQIQQPVQSQKPVQQPIQKKPIQPKQPIQRVSGYGQKPVGVQINSYKKIKEGIDSAITELEKIEVPEKQKQVQKVSDYGQKPVKTKEKLVLGILIFILIVLLGSLTSVFIFKEEVVGFLDGLFV